MSLYSSMAHVMQSSFAQIVNMTGNTTVSYKVNNVGSTTEYGEPVVVYSAYTITAVVQPVDERDIMFREPGFKADDHTKMFFNYTSSLTPKHLDRYVWNSIEFEVRYVMPRTVDDTIVYYEVVGKRHTNP